MQAIKCELCGSSDIMKQDGFFQCQNCGTKYSLEEARKLIGVVKIDKTEDIENLLTLAKRCFDEKNYIDSEKYYELALREKPNDWNIAFCRTYSQALGLMETDSPKAFKTLATGTASAIKIIQEHVDESTRSEAISNLIDKVDQFCKDLRNTMKADNRIGYWTYSELITDMGALYDQLEQFLKQHFPEHAHAIRTIQESYYDIVRLNPDSFKWSERRHILSRLKEELQKTAHETPPCPKESIPTPRMTLPNKKRP